MHCKFRNAIIRLDANVSVIVQGAVEGIDKWPKS